ncbi:hypothetical protein ACLOJK_005072 [Asimina triloba]
MLDLIKARRATTLIWSSDYSVREDEWAFLALKGRSHPSIECCPFRHNEYRTVEEGCDSPEGHCGLVILIRTICVGPTLLGEFLWRSGRAYRCQGLKNQDDRRY